MTTYDYQIYYDNGTVSELLGCLERIDLEALSAKPFFTINLPANEVRKVEQRVLVNMAHVTNINEAVQELDPDNADDIRRDEITKEAEIERHGGVGWLRRGTSVIVVPDDWHDGDKVTVRISKKTN